VDAAVLEFNSKSIPEKYKERNVFLYDFRSAIRLTIDESGALVRIVADMIYIFLSYCEEVPDMKPVRYDQEEILRYLKEGYWDKTILRV
jgi:hypothetical protein